MVLGSGSRKIVNHLSRFFLWASFRILNYNSKVNFTSRLDARASSCLDASFAAGSRAVSTV